jgi:hypothetical protein
MISITHILPIPLYTPIALYHERKFLNPFFFELSRSHDLCTCVRDTFFADGARVGLKHRWYATKHALPVGRVHCNMGNVFTIHRKK